MEFTGYDYKVYAMVKFTRAELDALIDMAELHYDHKCKSLARPTRNLQSSYEGLLCGLKNRMDNLNEVEARLSQSQLDLLNKVVEMPAPHDDDPITFNKDVMRPLRGGLTIAFKLVREKTEEMQNETSTDSESATGTDI